MEVSGKPHASAELLSV